MAHDESSRVVVGRERELAEGVAFLERSALGFAAALLVGAPGIGKTVLWEALLARAGPRPVLVHAASPAEARLSFIGLADLLGASGRLGDPSAGRIGAAIAALAPPRRAALEGALHLRDVPHDVGERPVGIALLDVLQALARGGPIVLAIDDLQWLDQPSGDALRFALRRLRDIPIGLLVTCRAARSPDVERLVGELAPERTRILELGPLGTAEVHQLLRRRLGLDLARPQLLRLHELSGGNPYYALELGAELLRSGARLDRGGPPSLPASLESLLGARLDRLARPALRVVEVASACARPDLRTLVGLEHDERAVAAAVGAAERAGILRVDGERLTFTHPLLASVAYRRLSTIERRRLHGRLAERATDPEEAARHLALAEGAPDAATARRIAAGAEHAAARGDTAAAADLAERASALVPPGHGAQARRYRLRAAEFLRASGDLDRAGSILDALVAGSPSGPERADALLALARVRRADLREAIRLCEQAFSDAAADRRRQANVSSYLGWLHQVEGRIPDAIAAARRAVDAAEAVGDPLLLARTLGRAAMEELWAMDESPGLLERAVELERSLPVALTDHDRPSLTLARRLALTGDFGGARAIYETAEREARERGDDSLRGRILFHQALLEWYDGRPVPALALAAEAIELADQLHDEQYRSMALHAASFIDAHLGLHDRARGAATEGLRLADAAGDALFGLAHRNVLGFVDLIEGDPRSAAARLAALPDAPISRSWVEPAFNPVWPNAIEAAALSGDLATATRQLEEFERRAARSLSDWSRAVAARCRGIVESAAGNLERADAAFAEAIGAHARVRAPFDRGRTLLAWGALHRRRKQKRLAREVLGEAGREFVALGARRWAERATAELSRIGGRPPVDRRLTPTEQRVAHLAADALSNKEIAAALGCAVGTVETHLSRIYAKLDLRSRVELGRALATATAPQPATAPALQPAAGLNGRGFP